MFLLHNFKLIPEAAFTLSGTNRAFQYNDGLFDTLIMDNGKIRFLPDHVERMQQALEVLQMQIPAELQKPEWLEEEVRKLANHNQLDKKLTRVKIHIWRAPGGLFTPEQNTAESLITVQEQRPVPCVISRAEIATSVQNNFSALSFFKGPFATKYVLASLEKKQKQVDELILLNDQDFVSEVLVANIFWIKDKVLYTPALKTGCIAGIIRKNILRLAATEETTIAEGFFKILDMLQAEVVFTSNVTGLRPILQINEKSFAANHPVLTRLKELLFPG